MCVVHEKEGPSDDLREQAEQLERAPNRGGVCLGPAAGAIPRAHAETERPGVLWVSHRGSPQRASELAALCTAHLWCLPCSTRGAAFLLPPAGDYVTLTSAAQTVLFIPHL